MIKKYKKINKLKKRKIDTIEITPEVQASKQ